MTRIVCAGACGKSAPAEPGRLPAQWVSYHDLPLCRGCHVLRAKIPALQRKMRARRLAAKERL